MLNTDKTRKAAEIYRVRFALFIKLCIIFLFLFIYLSIYLSCCTNVISRHDYNRALVVLYRQDYNNNNNDNNNCSQFLFCKSKQDVVLVLF